MTVLHLDTGRTWRGGQQQVLYLHRGLLARGVDSVLACTRGGELHRRAAGEGLPVEGLPLRGEWDLASAWAVGRLARRVGARVLHAHSSHAVTLAALARALLTPGAAVVATRRVDFVPGGGPFHRWKYRRPDRWVAISRAIQDILARFGVPADRLRVVPSGVDPSRARPGTGAAFRAELGLAPDAFLVGNVAHLADHKGQRYLVEAVPRVLAGCPRARFVIVGEGELEADLRRRADALGLGDRLVFTGFLDDVPAVLDGLDLFVLSSHLEGLGTIVLDALVAGTPVVATRTGGVPDVIDHGVHGLLVPPRDPGALAGAILEIAVDPGRAAELARAGRERVLREFSVDAMVDGNLRVYRELDR